MTARVPAFPGNGLDFITRPANEEYGELNGFDVPKEDYAEGNQTGVATAGQFMAAAQRSEDDDLCLQTILREVIRALDEGDPTGGRDRRGAAVGFICALERLLFSYAKTDEWREVLAESIWWHIQSIQDDAAKATERSMDRLNALGFTKPTGDSAAAKAARKKSSAVGVLTEKGAPAEAFTALASVVAETDRATAFMRGYNRAVAVLEHAKANQGSGEHEMWPKYREPSQFFENFVLEAMQAPMGHDEQEGFYAMLSGLIAAYAAGSLPTAEAFKKLNYADITGPGTNTQYAKDRTAMEKEDAPRASKAKAVASQKAKKEVPA